MREILNQILTGVDGKSHDIGRWSWLLSTFSVCGGAIANWCHGAMIDLVSLASALSLVAGAHGMAINIKKNTEPGVQTSDNEEKPQ